MSKKELIDILVKDFGWKEENLKNFNIEALEATLEKEKMIQTMKSQLEESKTKNVEAVEPVVAPKKQKRQRQESQFEDSDLIEVMNGAPSMLVYRAQKDGMLYEFEKYGDIEEMTFEEIKLMARRQRKFLENNWLIILDEDVINELRLGEYQKDFFSQQDFDDILYKDTKHRIDAVLKSNPSVQNAFLRRAIIMHREGKLESVSLLRKIENHFEVELDTIEIEEI